MTKKRVLKIIYKQRDKLIPYAMNSKTHSEAQIMRIAASIRKFDWTNPVLINGEDGILAGHARVLAAQKLGITDIPCIDLWDLSPAEQKAYIIADNKLAESPFDEMMLEAEFESLTEEGFDLDFTGFDQDERTAVHKRVEKAKNDALDGQKGEDDFGTVPMNPITRPGDVWHMGPHRIICGDSLEPKTLQALLGDDKCHMIATDPPYAIFGSSTGVSSDVADDVMVQPFFQNVLNICKEHLPWFGHAYVTCDWRSWGAIWQASKRSKPLVVKNLIVWDKGSGLGSMYMNSYEFVAFFVKEPPATSQWKGRPAGQRLVHKPNVMRHNRPTGEDREHNAAKPVALLRDLIYNSSGPGDVVLDLFAGSGSTLIAADQTDRICLAIDMEPKWCDVTVGRFMRLRETKATLGEGGPTFQEVAQQRIGDSPSFAPEADQKDDDEPKAVH